MIKTFSIFSLVLILFSGTYAIHLDYDNKADFMVFRPSEKIWFNYSSEGRGFSGAQWGLETDALAPADFDGDGLTDIAVWRPSSGTWYVIQSASRQMLAVQWGMITDFPFGGIPDVPVAADYDGDETADIAVWRPDTGFWHVLTSSSGFSPKYAITFQWGKIGDVPVPADYDGDGKTDFAVWRPTENRWYIRYSETGAWDAFNFGLAGYDLLVPADYTGDGKADPAVYREGNWFIRRSEDAGLLVYYFGLKTDKPVPADYDGDGKADAAVYRKGIWYILESANHNVSAFHFGGDGDLPIVDQPVRESIVALP